MSSENDIPVGHNDGETERVVPLRLQKFLARSGVASRRGSENLMTAGRVKVNGEVVTELGTKVDPLIDRVEVDDKVVTFGQEKVYLMLNKPRGIVTTMSDPQGRPTVAEIMPTNEYPGLFPIGRLDLDTSGLLLFTTDGELAHRVLHPKHKVEKRYRVLCDGIFTEEDAQALRNGVELVDGFTAPAHVTIDSYEKNPLGTFGEVTHVTCVITEGRKRQVRRMFKSLSRPVIELNRDAFGPLELGDLAVGSWRMLSHLEVESLRDLVF